MTDERITAYLLGELTDEESVRFEEECFAGENWPAEIGLAEEDLIDDYLRGDLSAQRRLLFERNFLVTEERHRRVTKAAGFLRYVDSHCADKFAAAARKPHGSSWVARFIGLFGGNRWPLRTGLAFGMVALLAVAVWVLRTRPTTFATLTLTVSADSSRAEGSRAARVRLPTDTDALKIHLRLPAPSAQQPARYRVELLDEGGKASSLGVAGQDGESVTVDVPASQLARGQYALRLFAVEPDGKERRVAGLYYFIVE